MSIERRKIKDYYIHERSTGDVLEIEFTDNTWLIVEPATPGGRLTVSFEDRSTGNEWYIHNGAT
jgi:hypothetical protein